MKENNTKEITKEITKRKVTSIWIDPFIWKNFYAKCRKLGLSTCHILEPFMYAFYTGTPEHPVSALPSVNLTLNVNRVVRKYRRLGKEEDVSLVENGSFSECANCDKSSVVRCYISEPHQDSIRFLCEEHFYLHLDSYKNIQYWKVIKKFNWSYVWK